MKSALAAVFLASTLVSCVQPPPPTPVVLVSRPYCPPVKKVTKAPAPAPAPVKGNVRVDSFGNKFEDTAPGDLEPVKSRPVVLDR